MVVPLMSMIVNSKLIDSSVGCFNQALLAKQAWRSMLDPNSLFARVLLGKYCWGMNFLEGVPKPDCSSGWRSILWGQDLLRKGLA